MKTLVAVLLATLAPASGPACDALRQKSAELRKDIDAWLARHAKDCPVCAGGSSCREGFERQDAARRQVDEWKKGHAPGCPSCGAARCSALDGAWSQALAAAQARHKEQDRKCDFDASRCDGWRRILDAEKARHEDMKRDHPALCEKCTPSCDEWRKRSQEASVRADDVARKHRERCQDCQRSSGCERSSLNKHESIRDRLALWKKHTEICGCARPEKRR